jgi:hypothetical protein
MLNKSFAALAALALIATMASPVSADTRGKKNTYRQYQNYGQSYGQYYGEQPYTTGRARSRPDPSSYDGRHTGQPRTCGHNFFQYDIEGVPVGPYCD